MVTKVRTIDFLPEIFKTKSNTQFLEATLDQLTQQPDFKRIQGYIGSKFGYGINSNDKYLVEPSKVRTNYQLEPSIIFKKKDTNVAIDALTYTGLIDGLKLQGNVIEDTNVLFSNQFYSWDSFVDLDKMINYSQYYWLPFGPESIIVSNTSAYKTLNYFVYSQPNTYKFDTFEYNIDQLNPIITLIRGGTYTFKVDQTSKFYIQYQPGVTGIDSNRLNVNTRDVYGVTDNGTDVGIVTFNVPLSDAQDEWNFPGNIDVDIATELKFDEINGKLVTDLTAIDGFRNYKDKTLLFYGNPAGTNATINQFYGDNYEVNEYTTPITFSITGTTASTNLITCSSTAGLVLNNAITLSGVAFGGLSSGGSITVTNTTTGTNRLTCADSSTLVLNQQITFLDSMGGLTAGKIYYIKAKPTSTTFTVSETFGGTTKTLSTSSGYLTGAFYGGDYYVKSINSPTTFTVSYEPEGNVALLNTSTGSMTASAKQGYFEDSISTDLTKHYYKINFVGNQSTGYVIKLSEAGTFSDNTKITVNYGTQYIGRNFVKNSHSELLLIPILTAPLDTLYYQDNANSEKFGIIKLIDQADSSTLNVNTIIGKEQYTSPNNIKFTNGLKIEFAGNVFPTEFANDQYYVEGVGHHITLLPISDFNIPEKFGQSDTSPFDQNPYDSSNFSDTLFYPEDSDYITISRNSINKNAWSRSNRWFHADVLNLTVQYAASSPVTYAALNDPTKRAKRPIIEFYPNLKLYNAGSVSKPNTTFINFTVTDALTQVAGQTSFYPDGDAIDLYDGATIIFAGDSDVEVRNKIYIASYVSIDGVSTPIITLSPVAWGNVEYNDQTVITSGETNIGQTYWFDGSSWNKGQLKERVNQPPKFDVFDINNISFGDKDFYPSSNFDGSTLFEYTIGTGSDDPVLKFPISYSSLNNLGDIAFTVSLNNQEFNYAQNSVSITQRINTGYVFEYTTRTDYKRLIGWQTAIGESFQYQVFNTSYTSIPLTPTFTFDIAVKDQTTTPWPVITVYVDNVRLSSAEYTYTVTSNTTTVTLTKMPAIGNTVDVLLYSDQVSLTGYYQVPSNLDHNPFNTEVVSVNLGDIRGHYKSICNNNLNFTGIAFGSNNYRDLGNIIPYGTRIIQHSSPLIDAGAFLRNNTSNFFDALSFSGNEYVKYKGLLIQTLQTNDYNNLDTSAYILDDVLDKIKEVRVNTNPFFWSDMLPSSSPTIINSYTFKSELVISTFNLARVYDFSQANYYGILIYLTRKINGTLENIQLVSGADYIISNTEKSVTITKDLINNDVITIKEYNQTYGSYIPNTPTKLGLYPASIPQVVYDNSYITPAYFIKGHDGSLTKLYGTYTIDGLLTDYRDRVMLEFETRIYNNLKLSSSIPLNYDEVVPGYFRNNGISYTQYQAVYSKQFLNWVGLNRVDYQAQTFINTNPLTYNYTGSTLRTNNQKITIGNWRGIYLWLYDSADPANSPWEMLGLLSKPLWWDSRYGIAPYTSDNTYMWEEISRGFVYNDGNSYVNTSRIRDGLLNIIPVDSSGKLRDPFEFLLGAYYTDNFENSWKVGDVGPAEYSYLNSSSWPFDLMRLFSLFKPAKFFALGIDLDLYRYDEEFNQYLYKNRFRDSISNLSIYGNGTSKNSYINWLVDYLCQFGIDGYTSITDLINNLDVRLTYRLAGFSDKDLLNFFVEKGTPNSSNNSLLIPDDSYSVLLYENQPNDTIVYSSVVIQQASNGYRVYGNSKSRTYFRSFVPIDDGAYDTISVNTQSVKIPKHYRKTSVLIPYGNLFTNKEDLFAFIRGYGKYLEYQGMTFDDIENGLELSWDQMIAETLYWIETGWEVGSIINVNPSARIINVNKDNSIVQPLTLTKDNFILNQNGIPILITDLNIYRKETQFNVKALNEGDSLSFFTANLSTIEHLVVFDNITVFNDVLYNLQTGLRQQRIYVKGSKSADWQGYVNASGFILNQDNILEWSQNQKYSKGTIVKFKNNYYSAKKVIVLPKATFDYTDWTKTSYDAIQKGLLPNPSTRSAEAILFYDTTNPNLQHDGDLLGFSLIGYRPRDYFASANFDDGTQVNLYKNMIAVKGTVDSVTRLQGINVQQNALNYTLHENWAIKTSEFGGVLNQNFVEVTLDQSQLTGNPSIVSIIKNVGVDGAQQEIPIYKIKNYSRPVNSVSILPSLGYDYQEKLPSAGYANLDDVLQYSYDINTLDDTRIYNLYKNDYIWVADKDNTWQIYTPIPSGIALSTVINNLNGSVTMNFNKPHNFLVDHVIGIINFDSRVDGYYLVEQIVSLTSLVVTLTLDPSVAGISGVGLSFLLQSRRVVTARDIPGLPLLNSEYGVNRVWVDYSSTGSWSVYEKTNNFNYEVMNKTALSTDTFGSGVAYIENIGYFVGDSANGKVYHYLKSSTGIYYVKNTISYPGTEFGKTIVTSQDLIVISAPGDLLSTVYVYKIPPSGEINSIILQEMLTVAGGRVGDAMALSGDSNWLFLGAQNDNTILPYQRSRVLSYTGAGLTLSEATVVNTNTFMCAGNVGSSLNEGQVVNFLATYTNLSMTLAVDTIDLTTYFTVNGDQRSKLANGDKVSFYTTGALGTYLYTIATESYDSGLNRTTFNTIEEFEASVIIPAGTSVYQVEFEDSLTYTVVTSTYDSTANATTFYTLEQVDYSASSGSYIYIANINFTLTGYIYSDLSSEGSNYSASLATNIDGTKLFVGAPNEDYSYSELNTGVVYVYDRLVEKYEVQYDQSPYEFYLLVTPFYLTNQARVYLNGVLIPPNKIVIILNVVIIGTIGLKAGDIIELSSTSVVNTFRLTSMDSPSDLRPGENFGFSVATNKYGSELIVGCPYDISSTSTKEGSVLRFTDEGKRYGTITGVIAANLIEATYIFINGYSVALRNDFGITSTVTAGVSSTVTVDPTNAALMPDYGVIKLSNNAGQEQEFYYSSINKTSGVISMAVTHITMTNITGNGTTVTITYATRTSIPFAVDTAIIVTGVSPNTYNGIYTVTYCSTTQTKFASTVTTAMVTPGSISDGPLYNYTSTDTNLVAPLGNALNIAAKINATQVTNIFAYASEDRRLHIRLRDQTLGQINNKLNISVFNGNYLYELGFFFPKSQTIQDPHKQSITQFGYAVAFNEEDSFVVSAPASTKYLSTTFDFSNDENNHNDCVFDNNFTTFEDSYTNAGSVYMYDYILSYDESLTNIGNYIYAQSCNDYLIDVGAQPGYGKALSYNNGVVMIGVPDFKPTTEGGRVVIYENTKNEVNWHLYRTSSAIVNVDNIQKAQLYNNRTDENLVSLDYIDPLQGKLLGIVRENIDFISTTDPAGYNSPGFNKGNSVWAKSFVGKIWYDTTTTKFLNYHQDDIVYNSKYFGVTFPGSNVTVYSWVESNAIPALYTGPGTPYDLGKYSIIQDVDSNNNLISRYFYWVHNTNLINTNQNKTLSDSIIQQYITDPRSSGISYMTALLPNTFGLYNSQEYINNTTTNLHLGFSSGTNDSSGHLEFQLIRSNYDTDFLPGFPEPTKGYTEPTGLYDRLLDSLSGVDESGAVVPDPNIPKLLQIGINVRPRQGFFIDRLEALHNYLEYANQVLAQYPINEFTNINFLYAQGEYYNTSNYWENIYWWATGYDSTTRALMEVASYSDLSTLTPTEGSIVGVASNAQGKREVYIYKSTTWSRIGLQNGTIKFLPTLWNYKTNMIGFGDSFFDNLNYDTYPSTETRYIIRSLNEEIYTDSLLEHRNASLILLFEYIQSENIESQNYLPWLNKTSFADVSYNVRTLTTNQKFQRDNQNLLEGYINEVKPYHVVMKEFYLKYDRLDTYQGDITDYDLPSMYNTSVSNFVSPQLVFAVLGQYPDYTYKYSSASTIWTSTEYTNWFNNYGLTIDVIANSVMATLTVYMSVVDTIIQVDNPSGFPVVGVIKLDNELISYTTIDRTLGILGGISRGVNNIIEEHYPGTEVIMDLPAINVVDGGRSYSQIPLITAYTDISKYPAPRRPASMASIMAGDKVIGVTVTDPGEGYVVPPEIIFDDAYSVTTDLVRINFIDNTMQIVTTTFATGDLVHLTASNNNGVQIIPDGFYYINSTGILALARSNASIFSFHTTYKDSLLGIHPVIFTNQNKAPSTYEQIISIRARAIPSMVSSKIRNIKPVLKFDRVSYESKIKEWVSGTYYASEYLSIGNDASNPDKISLATTEPITYNDFTVSPTGGTGAIFTVYNILMGAQYQIVITDAGLSYHANDIITILGETLGGNNADAILTGTTTDGSFTITTSSTTGVVAGRYIVGTGIPYGSKVVSFVLNTSITINYPTTASGSTSILVGPVDPDTTAPLMPNDCIIKVHTIYAGGGIATIYDPIGVGINARLSGAQGAILPITDVNSVGGYAVVTVDYSISNLSPGQIYGANMYFYRTHDAYRYDDSGSSGAIIDIYRPKFNTTTINNLYYLQIIDFGSIYNTGDIISIPGSSLGGTTGVNDCFISIQANPDGSIFLSTVTGTSVGQFGQFYVKPITDTEIEIYQDSKLTVPLPYSSFIWTNGLTDYAYLPEPITNNFSYDYQPISYVIYDTSIWECISSNNDTEFDPTKWNRLYSSDDKITALDRIAAYYEPTINMPGKDAQQLVKGITYPNNVYYGNAFAPEDELPIDFVVRDESFYPRNFTAKASVFDGTQLFVAGYSDAETSILKFDLLGVFVSKQPIISTPMDITSITYSNGVYLLTTSDKINPIFVSFDGVQWLGIGNSTSFDVVKFDDSNFDSTTLQAPYYPLYGSVINDGTYVAVGKNVIMSIDGLGYNTSFDYQSRLPTHLNDVIYVNNSTNFVGYIAVGIGYAYTAGSTTANPTLSETGIVLTTVDDGKSWQQLQPLSYAGLNSIANSGTVIVAVGNTGTIYHTTNVGNWVVSSITGSPVTTNINSVAYGNSIFVAVGDKTGILTSSPGLILTSTDGITWSQISSSSITTYNLYNVYYGNGQFYAVGDENTILSSSDGSTWQEVGTLTSTDPFYVVQGNDFLYGYGPEELVAGVVVDNLSMYVTSSPGAYWDLDVTNTFWYKHTGFNMQPITTSLLDLNYQVSFNAVVLNPARLSVFLVSNSTHLSYRIYENKYGSTLTYNYSVDWYNQRITFKNSASASALPAGYSLLIELYEVGNGKELVRGNSRDTPLQIDPITGNSMYLFPEQYQTIVNDPLIYVSKAGGTLTKLTYNTDYFVTSTGDQNLLTIVFAQVYDITTDYIVYSIVGDSTGLYNTVQYGYSIPESQVFVTVASTSIFTLDASLTYTAGDNVNNSIVEVNGLRLIPPNQTGAQYTLSGTTLTLSTPVATGTVVSITTFYDTSRQYLSTNKYATSGNLRVTAISYIDNNRSPLRVTFATDPDSSTTNISGQLFRIDGVNGMTEVNSNTYYLNQIDSTTYDLYASVGLTNTTVTGTNAALFITTTNITGIQVGMLVSGTGIGKGASNGGAFITNIQDNTPSAGIYKITLSVANTGTVTTVDYAWATNGDNFSTYQGSGYGWKDSTTIQIPYYPVVDGPDMIYDDGSRTWVTINGYRLQPSQLKFYGDNYLGILASLTLTETLIVTCMVTGASPNSTGFNITVDKHSNAVVTRTNNHDGTWLTQDFNIGDDIMYFYNALNLVEESNTTVNVVEDDLGVYAYVQCDINQVRQVLVYNVTTLETLSSSEFDITLLNGRPAILFSSGAIAGNSVAVTLIVGSIIEIDGERIRFASIDLANNTISGLTMGVQGTRRSDFYAIYTIAYGITPARQLTSAQYIENWNSTNITDNGDPLQISTTVVANFLNSIN